MGFFDFFKNLFKQKEQPEEVQGGVEQSEEAPVETSSEETAEERKEETAESSQEETATEEERR